MNLIYTEQPNNSDDIYSLYESLGWNDYLDLSKEQLAKAMKGSFYVLYAYDDEKLIGTGRVISDGVINAYLCGLGVDPDFRGRGIGKKISQKLIYRCLEKNLHIQLFCEEHRQKYYENMGFEVFAIGMKPRGK